MAVVENSGGGVQVRGVRDGGVVSSVVRMPCGCGGVVQVRGVGLAVWCPVP